MADLKLQLLGEIRVIRGEQELDLPPSKKTRALLAYLAVTAKRYRREQLCELLWEIPDDPRGSLRWSLSKIRRLVDDDQCQRIEADRNAVALNTEQLDLDINELSQLVKGDLGSLDTDTLLAAAQRFKGQFLDGLELANFHEFSSWCLAEREQADRNRQVLLRAIIQRLQSEPEQCLEFAKDLVAMRPYDKAARVQLIQLLVACARDAEAKQQVEQGSRLLQEVGEDTVELQKALKAKPAAETTAPKPALTAAVSVPQQDADTEKEQQISSQLSLVGRDEEIALVQKSWHQVVEQQQAQCLLFRGEPGIGKTSLLEFAYQLARAGGASIFRAGAYESEIVRPFALWNDALRESAHISAADLLSGEERIDRDRLLNSLAKLVGDEAKSKPVLVLFDDIQWSDESSAAALHFVLRITAQAPVWVVLGAREEELQTNFSVLSALRGLKQDKQLTSVLLTPLEESDVLKLIAKEAPNADMETISEKSRGNPFLALELARAVAAGDVIGTLNELIGERLARMRDTTVAMLQWAAVLAPNISIGALLRYTKLEDEALDAALEEAEKTGFLFATENGYKYSHDLVTRSIYRAISSARRRNMHRRVAELLEADTAIDLKLSTELARHAALSGDAQLAARSMLQAARLCLRFFANDDAYNLTQRGMTYLPELSEEENVCLKLELKDVQMMAAPVKDWQAEVDECIALAESALDMGKQDFARLGYQLASNMRWAHGQWSGAKKSIMQAERVSRGGSESNHIVGMAEAARCLLLLERDLPEADALLMEASARAERSQMDRVESNALSAAKGLMCYYEGKLDEAEEFLDEARTRAKAMGDRLNEFQAHEYLTMIEIEKGDFENASSQCAALMRIGDKLRKGSEAPFASALQSICRYAESGSAEGIDENAELLRKFDAKQRLTFVLNRTALLDLEAAKWDQAISRATEALKNAEIMDRCSEIITAHTILAQAYQGKADSDQLQQQVDALLAISTDAGAQWARQRADKVLQELQNSS